MGRRPDSSAVARVFRGDRAQTYQRWRWAAATGVLVVPLLGVATGPSHAGPSHAGPSHAGPSYSGQDRPAVVERRIIGHSVQDRPLRAWRLGNPRDRTTVVALATMHGDERVPRRTLQRLRDGSRIRGVDLWVLPTLNPDGLVRRSRYNARGVDLNRNFPVRWRDRPHAGRRPASAPETRALMRFLRDVRPDYVVSFHQPLRGVDRYQAKRPRFVRRLSESFGLPRKTFDCSGGCHGTMTQWFNRRFAGAAVTVEYGRSPRWRYVHVRGPRALLRAVGGRR